jgi:hypothetical protein
MMGSVSSFGLSIHTGSNIIDCGVCDSGNTLSSGFEGALWKILSDTIRDIYNFLSNIFVSSEILSAYDGSYLSRSQDELVCS